MHCMARAAKASDETGLRESPRSTPPTRCRFAPWARRHAGMLSVYRDMWRILHTYSLCGRSHPSWRWRRRPRMCKRFAKPLRHMDVPPRRARKCWSRQRWRGFAATVCLHAVALNQAAGCPVCKLIHDQMHARPEHGRSDLGVVPNEKIENGGVVLDAAFDFQDSDRDRMGPGGVIGTSGGQGWRAVIRRIFLEPQQRARHGTRALYLHAGCAVVWVP